MEDPGFEFPVLVFQSDPTHLESGPADGTSVSISVCLSDTITVEVKVMIRCRQGIENKEQHRKIDSGSVSLPPVFQQIRISTRL